MHIAHTVAIPLTAHIGAGAVVCDGAHIGEGAHVAPLAYIGPNVTIGAGATIGPHAVVLADVPAGATVEAAEVWRGPHTVTIDEARRRLVEDGVKRGRRG